MSTLEFSSLDDTSERLRWFIFSPKKAKSRVRQFKVCYLYNHLDALKSLTMMISRFGKALAGNGYITQVSRTINMKDYSLDIR